MICGPTAAGKSALALGLAERHHATIISADSRQIYRGFDIGTAKPSAEERRLVPHRGIDVAAPTERYSAARWAESATRWIAEARADGRTPLVVGGTGFYIRALVAPLFEEPPLDHARRAAIEALLQPMPTAELRRWCAALDPARAHLGAAQLRRAIVVALLTGRRISELQETAARPARVAARYLVVDPAAGLGDRIARRVALMLDAGWEDEVRALMRGVPPDAPAWNATGYRVIRRLASGELGRAEAEAAVVLETRRYAKRQRTWFRHQLPASRVTWMDPAAPDAHAIVDRWWHAEAA